MLTGAGAESSDSTLAEGRAALDTATRDILDAKKGTTFLSLPSGEEKAMIENFRQQVFQSEVDLEQERKRHHLKDCRNVANVYLTQTRLAAHLKESWSISYTVTVKEECDSSRCL